MSVVAERRYVAIIASVLIAVLCICAFASEMVFFPIWPDASGDFTGEKGDFTIDVSHMDEGYFMAMYEETSAELKMQVVKDGEAYTYDLNSEGEYECFPLQMGNGRYTCTVYKRVKSNKYSALSRIEVDVNVANEHFPYLSPSQYVYYEPEFDAVEASMLLCEDLETDKEKINAIVGYMVENFVYDYERARSNPGFYLGDAVGCFETRKGLCQDLSVVLACMLRVQGIPTQLVIGYADRYYHAWNKILIDGEYQLLDITAEITGVPASVYTEERHY